MQSTSKLAKFIIYAGAIRPGFLTAGIAPILVGSGLAYATAGVFQLHLFILAILSIAAFHAGSNMTNDYFDHLSGNDSANRNLTPFSGGSRYIQKDILLPREVLCAALIALAIGSAVGVVIILLTRSIFILILGLVGLLGGYFYTAPPVKLSYRGIGEPLIALLFGLLPVYGSYYLQTGKINADPFVPGIIVGILIFLIILINEFPDAAADASAGKKTFVVCFGIPSCVWIYRITLTASFIIAAAATIFYHFMFFAGLLYLSTTPLAVLVMISANKKELTTPGRYFANKITIFLHAAGSLAITVGFFITGFTGTSI